MERRREEEKILKHPRIGTYFLVILISVMILAASMMIIDYFQTKSQNEKLKKIREELILENEILKSENDKLGDPEYFSIYIKDYYYYNGKIIYK